jgi:hypothetical protein
MEQTRKLVGSHSTQTCVWHLSFVSGLPCVKGAEPRTGALLCVQGGGGGEARGSGGEGSQATAKESSRIRQGSSAAHASSTRSLKLS